MIEAYSIRVRIARASLISFKKCAYFETYHLARRPDGKLVVTHPLDPQRSRIASNRDYKLIIWYLVPYLALFFLYDNLTLGMWWSTIWRRNGRLDSQELLPKV